MRLKKVVHAADAVAVIRDGDTVASTGYGGNGTPDQLFVALEERFLATGHPRDLTLVFAGGQGDGAEKGLNRLGHEGLVKRVVGGHFGLMPKIEKLVAANRIEAYNFPEGVITRTNDRVGALLDGVSRACPTSFSCRWLRPSYSPWRARSCSRARWCRPWPGTCWGHAHRHWT